MTGLEAYKLFTSLNNHFSQMSYDYFKYGGNVTIKPETFENHKNRFRYEALAKKLTGKTKEDQENFVVANLIEIKGKAWIGSLAGDADEIYLRWRGRVESLQYNLTNEIKLLLEDHTFNELFKCGEHDHPEILKALIRGDVSLETFVILDLCIGFIKKLDDILCDDRIWMPVKNKAVKYRPFIERLNINVGNLSRAIQLAAKEMGVTH
jgi:hypothetical protein